jgi:CDP-diacylglycerol--glycerol-3-phosphate 3-phosphatidyltransferase
MTPASALLQGLRASTEAEESVMLDSRWRAEFERGLLPIGSCLRRAGITADQVTVAGLATSLFTGWAIAQGRFGWAAAGLAASGLTDVLDGAVAKSGGTAGPRGAFFDSVCDRISDVVVMAGAAWYLAGTQPHLSLLPFTVAALSFLVSYERSRAEALGLDGKGGLMERAERMAVLGVGLTFGVLVPTLWVLAVLTGTTALQRFVKVWRQVPPVAPASPADQRRGLWVTIWPVRSDESGLAGWRWAARPPGDRAERSRLSRWLLSARPPASEPSRRRWPASRPTAGVRSQLRRLRSRTRP